MASRPSIDINTTAAGAPPAPGRPAAAAPATEQGRLRRLRDEFRQVPLVCGGIVLALEIFPKPPLNVIRLACTLAYFGALLKLLWHMTRPREEYLRQLYEWSYRDCSEPLEHNYKMYLSALNRVVRYMCWIAMALVGSLALDVLEEWPPFAPLRLFGAFYTPLFFLSAGALVMFPGAFSGFFVDAFGRRRLLHEAAETEGFKPRSLDDPDTGTASVAAGPPVVVTGERTFQAGGTEWAYDDFYKSCMVFGSAGSGKTVCVLNALLDGLLASTAKSRQPVGGLFLDPKGAFLGPLKSLCAKYGRSQDLLILDPLDPEESIKWNPLDSDDDELEIAGRFAAVMESVGQKAGDNSFWVDSARKFARHAMALTRLSNPEDEPPAFADIAELAQSWDKVNERGQAIRDFSDPRARNSMAFFVDEWDELANETRSSIQAYLTNMIDPFLMEPYRSFFTGRSDWRVPEIMDEGKILYVHMPVADKEEMSKVICTFVKLEYFREVLKRPDKPRPSFFFCDEFQSFFTTAAGRGDADFFERSRQSNHANIVATQNLYALLKGRSEEPVMNLLGNCAVKVFLRNTDVRTNRYGSELFGKKLVLMGNASYGSGRTGGGAAGSTQYDDFVRAEEFPELKVPDRRSKVDFAEAIVHLGSRGTVERLKLRFKVHPLG